MGLKHLTGLTLATAEIPDALDEDDLTNRLARLGGMDLTETARSRVLSNGWAVCWKLWAVGVAVVFPLLSALTLSDASGDGRSTRPAPLVIQLSTVVVALFGIIYYVQAISLIRRLGRWKRNLIQRNVPLHLLLAPAGNVMFAATAVRCWDRFMRHYFQPIWWLTIAHIVGFAMFSLLASDGDFGSVMVRSFVATLYLGFLLLNLMVTAYAGLSMLASRSRRNALLGMFLLLLFPLWSAVPAFVLLQVFIALGVWGAVLERLRRFPVDCIAQFRHEESRTGRLGG